MRKIGLDEQKQLELDIMLHFDNFCRENGLTYLMTGGTLLGAVRHGGYIPWDDDIDVMMFRDDYEKFFDLYAEKNTCSYLKLVSCRDRTSIYPFFKIVDTRTVVYETYVDPKYTTGVWIDIFPIDRIDSTDEAFKINEAAQRKYGYLAANTSLGTTPFRRFAKMVLKLLMGRDDLYKVADDLDKTIAGIDPGDCQDIALVIWGYGTCERTTKDLLVPVELSFEGYSFFAPAIYEQYLTMTFGDYMKLPPIDLQVPHACEAYWLD